jgi:hypothetical protein
VWSKVIQETSVLRITDSQFKIAPEKVVPAFEDLITFYHEVKDEPFFDGTFPPQLAEVSDLASFLDTLGYLVGFDDKRAVDYLITYEPNPYRGDEYLFATLAPYVTAGSYIELEIGDAYYRWEFNGKYLMEFKGSVYYTNHMLVAPRDFTRIDLEKDSEDDDSIIYPEYEDQSIFEEEPAAPAPAPAPAKRSRSRAGR